MGANSNIEWTDRTWNPITGCTRVSAGCDNCYAVTMTKRLEAMGNTEKYGGLVNLGKGHFNGTVKCHEDALLDPLKWRKPQKVFVNSMSDVFHKDVPFEFIDKVFAVMALCPHHTFQVLTKRPERMAEYLNEDRAEKRYLEAMGLPGFNRINESDDYCIDLAGPLPNVWLGTSVEDQTTADERIPQLLRCPAAVRFLSCEPLLGPVDLNCLSSGHVLADEPSSKRGAGSLNNLVSCLRPHCWDPFYGWNSCYLDKQSAQVHWVICGGESGPNARPLHPDWARSLRDQCQAAGVAFHFKQWGEWLPGHHFDIAGIKDREDDGCGSRFECTDWNGDEEALETDSHWTSDLSEHAMFKVGKHRAGRMLDGRTWDEFPEVRE